MTSDSSSLGKSKDSLETSIKSDSDDDGFNNEGAKRERNSSIGLNLGLPNTIQSRATQMAAVLIRARQDALEYIDSIDLEDDELFRSVQFEDHLVIVAESGDEVGEFNISITPAQYRSFGECFKVTTSSRGTVDGVVCGTMLTAFVSKGLLTLEQQHHEYIRLEKSPVDRKTTIMKKEDRYQVDLYVVHEEKTHHTSQHFSPEDMHGVITEGCNLILMRLMVGTKMPADGLHLVALDTYIQLCRVIYNPLGTELHPESDVELFGLERTMYISDQTTMIWRSYFSSDRHLVRRLQVGGPVTMKAKTSYSQSDAEESSQKKMPIIKPINWEDDMELTSIYLQRKEELIASHTKYLRDNPEAQAIVADFLQLVLQRKPDDVFSFAATYFATFSSSRSHKFELHASSALSNPHAQCHTSSRINILTRMRPDGASD